MTAQTASVLKESKIRQTGTIEYKHSHYTQTCFQSSAELKCDKNQITALENFDLRQACNEQMHSSCNKEFYGSSTEKSFNLLTCRHIYEWFLKGGFAACNFRVFYLSVTTTSICEANNNNFISKNVYYLHKHVI